jgi:hypothetical protein
MTFVSRHRVISYAAVNVRGTSEVARSINSTAKHARMICGNSSEQTEMIDLMEQRRPGVELVGQAPDSARELLRIRERAAGRWALDHDEPMTQEQIALLASIELKTVRNAISSKRDDQQ